MSGPILPISPATLPEAIRPAGEARASGGAFQEIFTSAINSVEGVSHAASSSVERFLSGEGEELHTAALATQRAALTFDLFLQTRNKVVSAYQEIMRMQM